MQFKYKYGLIVKKDKEIKLISLVKQFSSA